MNKLKRLFRHLRTTTRHGRNIFPAETLKAIETAIAVGENTHRAEIRLIVEPALSVKAVLDHVSSRQRAVELFSIYRIWDTDENCGVLVYLNLADHKVEIVTDRGIGSLINPQEWRSICDEMTKGFSQKDFHGSTLKALDRINLLLQTYYPAQGKRPNQLSNQPFVL